MFIKREDLVEKFASLFVSDADGCLYFQPSGSDERVLVSAHEMESVLSAYRRRTRIAMIITWISLLSMFLGLLWDAYARSFEVWHLWAVPAAWIVMFSAHWWAARSTLTRFIDWLSLAATKTEAPPP